MAKESASPRRTAASEVRSPRTVEDSAAQLKRLLLAIPALADNRAHRIRDVAERVGTDEATLSRDLRTLVTRFGGEPGGFVEGVQLAFGPETVQLHSLLLRRPMGLSRAELRAIELGLAIIRQEVTPPEESTVDRARARVAKAATSVPRDSGHEVTRAGTLGGSTEDIAHLTTLRQALAHRCKARIGYRSAKAAAAAERTVHPYGIVYSRGSWFLIAFCDKAHDLRVFRVDRLTSVRVLDRERATEPPGFSIESVLERGRVMSQGIGESVRIRYSARIARWIAEREVGEVQGDGSLVVEHPLGDDEWAVRHVLQYGADAEVLGPERVREAVVARLGTIMEGIAGGA